MMLTRLAPTPSGFLHAGNIYNFLLSWHWARANGGKVLLRIDDADAERKRPGYLEDIFRVLEWIGLDWDIGPAGPGDFEKNWSQHHRRSLYDELLNELAAQQMLFACTCSRRELAEAECRCKEKQLSLDTPEAAWRIQISPTAKITFNDKAMGDTGYEFLSHSFIVRRKDGIAAYQLASLADDRHFGVTHICRGEDLLPSTAMQLYLDKQLKKPYLNKCSFWHHPLLMNHDGEKLSKSAGYPAKSIMNSISKEELLSAFTKWTSRFGKDIFSLH